MDDQDETYLKKYLPADKYDWGLELLRKGVPVQYIIGNVCFYGNIINVNENVLIPRFETELLVEKATKYIEKLFDGNVNILDIGTGSGAIAISLDKLTYGRVDAIDISEDALKVAKSNNVLNETNVNFFMSDVFSNVHDKYDVIISNPPYIAYDEEIMDIVYDNEPHMALYAPDNGLYFYDKILSECLLYLKSDFLIAFEIGYRQGEDIKDLVLKYLDDVYVSIERDYSGKDRFVFISNRRVF